MSNSTTETQVQTPGWHTLNGTSSAIQSGAWFHDVRKTGTSAQLRLQYIGSVSRVLVARATGSVRHGAIGVEDDLDIRFGVSLNDADPTRQIAVLLPAGQFKSVVVAATLLLAVNPGDAIEPMAQIGNDVRFPVVFRDMSLVVME